MSSKPVWATWEDPVSHNKTTKGKVERCIQFLDFGILNHPGILLSDPATLIFLTPIRPLLCPCNILHPQSSMSDAEDSCLQSFIV